MSLLIELIANLPTMIVLGLNLMIFFASTNYQKINRSKKTPAVSVIIAAWNEGKRIGRCVNSILNLDYPKDKIEIIVVGGGTDDTGTVCKQLAGRGYKKKHRMKMPTS